MQSRPGLLSDVRLRIVALVAIAFGFSTLEKPLALSLMVMATIALVWVFGLQYRELMRRLRWPGLVIGGLVTVLPFVSGGTVLASAGPLALHEEGLTSAIEIAARFFCIVTVATVLLGSVSTSKLVSAMRDLGLPVIMADMTLLALRYVDDLRRDLHHMRTAMWLRGVQQSSWWEKIWTTGWALAALLLRSQSRSERVYYAMILRGHGTPTTAFTTFRTCHRDIACMAALLGSTAALIILECLAW